jgi:hypothetical protein
VPDEGGAADAEVVEEGEGAVGVARDAEFRARGRRVAPAVAEEIEDHRAVAEREAGDDARPEVGGGEQAVEENERVACAAGARGVVIEAGASYVDELTSHGAAISVGVHATIRPAMADAATV